MCYENKKTCYLNSREIHKLYMKGSAIMAKEKETIEPNKKERKNNKPPKIVTKTLFCVAAVVILVVTFILGIKVSTVFTTQEKTTKFGLEDVGKLVTQTCYTTVLEDSKVNRDFFKLFDIPFTESRQIFSYDFEVDASIDFDKIKIKKIDDEKKTIHVEIPHAEVYKASLNPSSFRVYLDTESLFSRIDLEDHNEAIKKMQEQAQNDCVANDLLTSADKNAKKLLSGIIKGNPKYKNYTVNFTFKGGK